jgi:hypothetical protein
MPFAKKKKAPVKLDEPITIGVCAMEKKVSSQLSRI